MADGRRFVKTVKSRYHCNRLTDFDEIWRGDAHWPLTADRPLKFRIFENPRWRRPPSWKLQKSRWFERSLRNFVWWCKMGPLAALTDKKIQKQDDGRPPFWKSLNRHISATFDRFWWNLAPCGRLSWLMSAFERTLKWHLVSYRNACWSPAHDVKFKFSTFDNCRKIAMLHGRPPLSRESKNCLNILCRPNSTITHYTILTIKQ